jgi:hypothetical protein
MVVSKAMHDGLACAIFAGMSQHHNILREVCCLFDQRSPIHVLFPERRCALPSAFLDGGSNMSIRFTMLEDGPLGPDHVARAGGSTPNTSVVKIKGDPNPPPILDFNDAKKLEPEAVTPYCSHMDLSVLTLPNSRGFVALQHLAGGSSCWHLTRVAAL